MRLGYFFEMETDSDTIYLSSLRRDVSWDGHTWLGNGWFLGTESVEEDVDISPESLTIRLTGIPAALISILLQSISAANAGTLYLVCFDADWAVVSNPYQVFTGKLDEVEIIEGPNRSDVSISYIDDLYLLTNSSGIRYTQGNQQLRYSTDVGFDFVQTLGDRSLRWGGAENKEIRKEKRKGKKKKKRKDKRTRKKGL